MKLVVLTILLCFNISTSWTQAPPSAIDHANNVTAQLVSLDSVNITWRVPSDNAPITRYALTFCAIFSPTDTDCLRGTSVNITIPVGDRDLIRIGGNQLRYTFSELLTEKLYEVVVRAENSVGRQMSPAFGNGLRFSSAVPDDGRVVNVSFIPTTSTIIVTWNLPPLALATANLNVSFDVTYYSVSDPSNTMSITIEYNPMRLEQGFSANIGIEDSPSHVFQIAARYINPNLLSSQATLTDVRTLANDATLLTGPRAVITNSVGPNDVLTISWLTPNSIKFLVAYHVSYTISSAHNRRQAPSTREVPAGTTSTTLPFTAFMNYTVNIDAIYAPPPDGNRVFVNLLPPTVFTTPERQSSPPRNIMAVNETILKLRLSWTAPETPNGIITGYRIRRGNDFELRIENRTYYITQELAPNTMYTFQIQAINGFGDGELSLPMTFTTDFGVIQPVITSTVVGSAGAPRFTISIDPFSDRYGRVGAYKVVVVRGNRVDPSTIPDSHLAPAAVSPFNFYVAYYGDLRRQRQLTFIIGDNIITTDDRGIIFTNPPPETGVDYYVFIRLYSAIDRSVFADSQLSGVLRFGPSNKDNITIATTGTQSPNPPNSQGATPRPTISLLLLIIISSLILVFNVV